MSYFILFLYSIRQPGYSTTHRNSHMPKQQSNKRNTYKNNNTQSIKNHHRIRQPKNNSLEVQLSNLSIHNNNNNESTQKKQQNKQQNKQHPKRNGKLSHKKRSPHNEGK